MNQKQKVRIFAGFFFAFTVFSVIPFGSQIPKVSAAEPSSALEEGGYSGLIPCGRSGAQGEASQPCTACHAVVGAKRAMDYLTGIMVVVAVTVIVAMGILYIISGVNVNLKKTAKAGLLAVVTGLVFMLSAWLIVSTILRFMANDNFIKGGGTADGKGGFIGLMPGDGAYGLQCNTRSAGGTAQLTPGAIRGGEGKYAGGSSGNGTCSPMKNAGNPCSVANLEKTCWGQLGLATQASMICNVESNGIPDRASGTDHCGKGGPSMSHGLFQINLTSNAAAGCVGIANPPLAHVRKYPDGWYDVTCKITNMSKMNACIAKTHNAAWNIQEACNLYKNGGWQYWPLTRKKCGL